jgi:HAD superfamily hydrolase (TIGR01509 family)
MNRIRAIVFDCDGVLFESRRANLAYYNAVLTHFDEPHVMESDQARAHLCHTAASPHVFSQLLGLERTPLALSLASELDYRQFIPLMSPEPGMQDALARLSATYPLAVATNRGYSMPSILEHFGLSGYFNTVVTSRDVERPKPAPDMLHEAAKRLQCATHQMLFVGDSELDQAAAQEAGMPFANYRGVLKADVQLGHHNELVELLLYGKEAKDQHEDAKKSQ